LIFALSLTRHSLIQFFLYNSLMLKTLFSRQWRIATLLVIVAIGVQVGLAFWQLERLQERRAYNARVQAQLDQPPLTLEAHTPLDDLSTMEYRPVVVRGEFDFTQEVALRGQSWNGTLGARLLTPLRIADSDRAVLVDRGWIPYEETENGHWPQYAQPGEVIMRGRIRASRQDMGLGFRTDPTPVPGERLTAWNQVNVEAIGAQMPYSLLPVYIQQAPDTDPDTVLPYAGLSPLDLSDGSHLGYAGQWFMFAIVFAVGYPLFVRHQLREAAKRQAEPGSLADDSGARLR
jgi:surfeit locus 1 family protein